MSTKEEFLDAIKNGNLSEVKRLVDEVPYFERADVNACFSDGTTPLYVACAENREEIADFLKTRKGTILGAVPVVAQTGDFDVFKRIMDVKTINELPEETLLDLLGQLRCQNQSRMAAWILKKSIQVSHKTIVNSAKDGDVSALKFFIGMNYDMNQPDANKMMPIHWAAVHGCMDAVKLLVENGADIFAEGLWIPENEHKDNPRFYGKPSYLAERRGYRTLAGYLKQCEAEQSADYKRDMEIQRESKIRRLVQREHLNPQKLWGEAIVLIKDFQKIKNDVEKLVIVGYLCDILSVLPYPKSMELYKNHMSKMDKCMRVKIETAIRNARERN